jgi:tripartite-type tricarboxylate transporter receptor subunit TctC
LSTTLIVAGTAIAAPYPEKPIKLIVAWSPGGTTDILARIIAQGLSEKLGQTVLVENKPGGGNNIGTEYVIRSAPDGYTLNMTNPANAINASLYKGLSFNFINDTVPVAGVVRTPNVMVVTAALPVKNVDEFIAYCKANPTKVNMASSGSGSSIHSSGELFKIMTGCKMAHIPYKGAGPALNDLIAGQVQVMFATFNSLLPLGKGNKIKLLAVTGAKRSELMPDVPTFTEQGIPEMENLFPWYAVLSPANTPKDLQNKIYKDFSEVMQLEEIKKQLSDQGIFVRLSTSEQLKDLIKTDIDRWKKLVQQANIPTN